jgi:hypothetical protein
VTGSTDRSNRPYLDGAPLFLLFLQEIISDEPSSAAGILDFRRRGERKNSGTTADAERLACSLTKVQILRVHGGVTPNDR